MTYEELNEVRTLKEKILQTQDKIKALEDCIKPASVKFARGYKYDKKKKEWKSYTCLDVMPKSQDVKSPTEILAIMIADAKQELAALQKRLSEAIPELAKKIQSEVTDKVDQTLMIYRYIACEYFRDIGFKMGYSERWIYFEHKKILKKVFS